MPAAVICWNSPPRAAGSMPISRSTSRVARTWPQAATARPPITAIGRFSGTTVRHTCSSATRTGLAAMLAPLLELFHQMNHHRVMFGHLLDVPRPVRRTPIAVRTDAPAQPTSEELVAYVHPLHPQRDALLRS